MDLTHLFVAAWEDQKGSLFETRFSLLSGPKGSIKVQERRRQVVLETQIQVQMHEGSVYPPEMGKPDDNAKTAVGGRTRETRQQRMESRASIYIHLKQS